MQHTYVPFTPNSGAHEDCYPPTFSFDATEYKKERFLNTAKADIEGLAFCVGRALWQQYGISTDIKYELIGCGFPNDGVWRTVAQITLIFSDGGSANFTFAAFETSKGRRFDFESDGMHLRHINLDRNVKKVLQHLADDVMKQRS